jgi:hypothetical protein
MPRSRRTPCLQGIRRAGDRYSLQTGQHVPDTDTFARHRVPLLEREWLQQPANSAGMQADGEKTAKRQASVQPPAGLLHTSRTHPRRRHAGSAACPPPPCLRNRCRCSTGRPMSRATTWRPCCTRRRAGCAPRASCLRSSGALLLKTMLPRNVAD